MSNSSSSSVDKQSINQNLSASPHSKRDTSSEQLIRVEKFAAIRALSKSVSHQFNNLLTTPLGGISILLAEPDTHGLSAEALEILNEIKESLNRMADCTKGLANATGSTAPLPGFCRLNVNPLIRDELKPNRKSISKQPTELTLDLKSQVPFPANAPLIRKTIRALLDNALDAAESVDRKGDVKVSSWDEKHHITMEVSDNGSGMDTFARRHCHEPFFSTKGPLGIGLGLTIVQLTAQIHGADLEIDSPRDQGTSIRLRFPINDSRIEQ